MADRPLEQGVIRCNGGRYRLSDVEAVHLKHFAFRACGRGSGLKALVDEERVAGDAGRQGKGDGNESGTQIKARQERTPGDIDARNERAAQEAKIESGEWSKMQMERDRRQQHQADPQRERGGHHADRKILFLPARNHQPDAKEEDEASA
ncbi:MAG TPA: hypothetical protein VKY22_00795 [Bradyrhizobium sp.]|nr:hypothetical protein [Bradyrhizobium sp.]